MKSNDISTYMADVAANEDSYWWCVGRKAVIVKVVTQLLTRKSLLLNLGSGTGGISNALASHAWVVNYDYSLSNLQLSKNADICYYTCGDGVSLPFRDDSLDGIICLDVIEHIERHEQVLAEGNRVLRPDGGWMLISVPAHQWLWSSHDEFLNHYRRYKKSELAEMLTAAGFKIRFITYFNALLLPLALVRKVMEMIGWPPDKSSLPASDGLLNQILKQVFIFEKHFIPKPGYFFGTSLLCLCAVNKT